MCRIRQASSMNWHWIFGMQQEKKMCTIWHICSSVGRKLECFATLLTTSAHTTSWPSGPSTCKTRQRTRSSSSWLAPSATYRSIALCLVITANAWWRPLRTANLRWKRQRLRTSKRFRSCSTRSASISLTVASTIRNESNQSQLYKSDQYVNLRSPISLNPWIAKTI